ncbi:envelope protein UL43 [Eptesicus fuscus gammaherpesvirus]|uniref:Envelope protein UL43 n=1 Tax=vespertilionid gammaherpesvirus 3 TaxID=2846598 RepID=A0A2D0ZP08_9GAMA|nr:envelope protein UL43 [Eptesicus fuscus gammaherpesvirus]ATA58289.1 envelope protein UL43 [Eptesicus fuscus gammaherpesvirus]WAH70912.1 protein 58 [Eptesicus fuscus gammaherpesvirus]
MGWTDAQYVPVADVPTADWFMLSAAFGAGTLAAAPLIWLYLYISVFSLSIFVSWQMIFYTWAIVAVQAIMLVMLLSRGYALPRRFWGPLCICSLGLVFSAALVDALVPGALGTARPVIFTMACMCLSPWLPAAVQIVYLCQRVVQCYFELGLAFALVLYYCLVYLAIYTQAFYLPLAAFLAAGPACLDVIRRHRVYQTGLERCRAVFTCEGGPTYNEHSITTTCNTIGLDLAIMCIMTLVSVGGTISLALNTPVLAGLRTCVFFFCVGNITCAGLSDRIPGLYWAYMLTYIILVVLIHIFAWSWQRAALAGIFSMAYLCFFGAMGVRLQMARLKLARGINSPSIVTAVALFFNIVQSVTFISLNKFLA